MDVLDPRTRGEADQLARRIWVDTEGTPPRVVRSALEEAMAEQRIVRIRYTSRTGEKTTRDVEPVIFASTNGRWYLVGWCHLRNGTRWFLVTRIERATVPRAPCSGHGVDEIGTPPTTARSTHSASQWTGSHLTTGHHPSGNRRHATRCAPSALHAPTGRPESLRAL